MAYKLTLNFWKLQYLHINPLQATHTCIMPLQSLRRRRHAHPLVIGIVSTVNSVPHVDPTAPVRPEEHNFSLLVSGKDSMEHLSPPPPSLTHSLTLSLSLSFSLLLFLSLSLIHVYGSTGLGFKYEWESLFRVTDVTSGGPAHQILEVGDRILQVRIHSYGTIEYHTTHVVHEAYILLYVWSTQNIQCW